jgi:hypothetical protein
MSNKKIISFAVISIGIKWVCSVCAQSVYYPPDYYRPNLTDNSQMTVQCKITMTRQNYFESGSTIYGESTKKTTFDTQGFIDLVAADNLWTYQEDGQMVGPTNFPAKCSIVLVYAGEFDGSGCFEIRNTNNVVVATNAASLYFYSGGADVVDGYTNRVTGAETFRLMSLARFSYNNGWHYFEVDGMATERYTLTAKTSSGNQRFSRSLIFTAVGPGGAPDRDGSGHRAVFSVSVMGVEKGTR